MIELLLKTVRKYLAGLESNFKNDNRAVKERNCLVKVLEHQLREMDPNAVSLGILNLINGFVFPRIHERVFFLTHS